MVSCLFAVWVLPWSSVKGFEVCGHCLAFWVAVTVLLSGAWLVPYWSHQASRGAGLFIPSLASFKSWSLGSRNEVFYPFVNR